MLDKLIALGISEETARGIIEDHRVKEFAVPCDVYSRVSGYFQPTRQWNPGKKSEFVDRRMLIIPTSINV